MDDERKVDAHGFNWFQRKSKGVSAGDVFSVPLEGGGFGFGRVLNAHDGATLAEFFKYWSAEPEFNDEMLESGRLFSPVGFLISDIQAGNRKRSWQVIHKDPEFYPEDLYEIPFCQSHDSENWTYYTLHDDEKTLGKVSAEDVRKWKVASQLPQHRDRIAAVVEDSLKEVGLIPA